ncbi:hypothetical protein AB9K24_14990 [Meridianimaribacter flavus]
MDDLNKYVAIYKEQLAKGDILIAYNGLVKFVMKLRTDFIKNLSNKYTFAGILHGYMDYTYFYFSNDLLKSKKLKFALVLNHLEMTFEIWLLGNTLSVQKTYWELLKMSKWNENRSEMPKYAVLEATLVSHPDFNSLDKLSKQIEDQMLQVSKDIISTLKE